MPSVNSLTLISATSRPSLAFDAVPRSFDEELAARELVLELPYIFLMAKHATGELDHAILLDRQNPANLSDEVGSARRCGGLGGMVRSRRQIGPAPDRRRHRGREAGEHEHDRARRDSEEARHHGE